jgi:membrane protein YdbS with pleckstrin-like domain
MTDDAIAADDTDWRPLPPRARKMFVLGHAAMVAPLAIPVAVLTMVFHLAPAWIVAPLALFAAIAIGARIGARRFASTAWRLDPDGFAHRRGRMWFRDTRVPFSRVQHLDLKHGPLERRWNLATLVIHTAGSKMSAVSISGLDADDAERLRDHLARQIDLDDAL